MCSCEIGLRREPNGPRSISGVFKRYSMIWFARGRDCYLALMHWSGAFGPRTIPRSQGMLNETVGALQDCYLALMRRSRAFGYGAPTDPTIGVIW